MKSTNIAKNKIFPTTITLKQECPDRVLQIWYFKAASLLNHLSHVLHYGYLCYAVLCSCISYADCSIPFYIFFMCYNMVIYAMPCYVLAQFMPTVPCLFTYLHLVPALCLEYFSCANTRKQLNVQDRFILKYSTAKCFL